MTSVSFIVPIWNKLAYLPECVDSLLAQNIDDCEFVFVEDASTDGSREWLRKLDIPNSTIILNSANLGPGLSRNNGIKASKGKYIRFVDADDILPPNSTLALISACEQASSPVVRGNFALFDTLEPQSAQLVFPVEASRGRPFWSNTGTQVPWLCQAHIFRRDFLVDANHLFPDLRWGEDPVFLARILCDIEKLDTIADLVYLGRSRKGREPIFSALQIADYFRHLCLVSDIFVTSGRPELANAYSRRGIGDIKSMVFSSDLDANENTIVIERILALEASLSSSPSLSRISTC